MNTTDLAPWPQLTGSEPCRADGAEPENWTGTLKQREKGKEECLANCPESTRRQCLAWALDHPTHAGSGIWAGTTYTDRRRLRELRKAATD
ncbi:WhiB family transcriptional regulator [Streptomyces antarcticus]|uniref:WhiB family transcriptional regulator n=1 Tax=Streptomyces antarcticus TaxID=2996458 RepID=UPI00226F0043|nr:WhiB family transcriptional regulator [Streptomyces sp. H34-AA3]MCY0946293.1 WhiB family transcriptional regulator [Streptomyces sp. H34-AA3]